MISVYDLAGELDGRGSENRGALFPYLNHRPSLERRSWGHLRTLSAVGGRERRVLSVVGHVIFPFRAAMLLRDDKRSEYVHAP